MTLFLMLGTGFAGTLNADPLDNSENGHPLFLERLAERFDLDIDEIMDFMKELREEKKIGTTSCTRKNFQKVRATRYSPQGVKRQNL